MTTPGNPAVAVVIPCLDAADVLPRQLRALAAQHVTRSWEVVVVDNGSTDGTTQVATSFQDQLTRLRVVDEPRRGRHHACNAGLAATTAPCVLFVDADDEVHPGYVEAMAKALDTSAVVASAFDHERFAGGEPDVGLVQVAGLADGFGFLPFAGGGSLGVRREAFLAVGGFHAVPFAEDVDLSWRFQLEGYEIAFVPEARIAIAQRHDLRSMFRQHRRFGQAQAFLYLRYAASGMPRRGVGEVAAEWRRSLLGLLASRDRGQRSRAVRRLARNVGRLIGSIRARVVYL